MRKIDRFLQYLDYKGVTENKATVDCSLSKGLLGQAKSGKSDLGNKAVEKILSFYQDLSKVWLLTGEGSMLNTYIYNEVSLEPSCQTPSQEEPQERNSMLDSLLSLVESQRKDIETLIQLTKDKDERIERLTQELLEAQQDNNALRLEVLMLTPNGKESANNAEDFSSANAI